MKKLIILLFIVLITTTVSAQVAINTTGASANTSAALDISSATKGLLPPRITLTNTTSASPLAAHVAGMVVYNTATINDVVPGLYVNNGTAWVKQIGPATTDALTEGATNLYYTEARVSANTSVAANTAKTGITSTQASAIVSNTAKVTNATHTGDVTGATILTIGNAKVTNAKVATGIDAAKLADGTVSNTELQYINTVTSNLQAQLEAAKQYVIYYLTATSTTGIISGNYCPFNGTMSQNDTMGLILRVGGRVFLKAGYRYKMTGFIASLGTTSYFGYSIFNANTGAGIGTFGGGYATSGAPDSNANIQGSFAFVSPTSDTLYELRLTGGTIVNWYSGNSNLPGCYLIVECLGKI